MKYDTSELDSKYKASVMMVQVLIMSNVVDNVKDVTKNRELRELFLSNTHFRLFGEKKMIKRWKHSIF